MDPYKAAPPDTLPSRSKWGGPLPRQEGRALPVPLQLQDERWPRPQGWSPPSSSLSCSSLPTPPPRSALGWTSGEAPPTHICPCSSLSP